MLEVLVNFHPSWGGPVRTLSRIQIINDGSLSQTGFGNYDIVLQADEGPQTLGRVENFDRDRGNLALTVEAFRLLGGDR